MSEPQEEDGEWEAVEKRSLKDTHLKPYEKGGVISESAYIENTEQVVKVLKVDRVKSKEML